MRSSLRHKWVPFVALATGLGACSRASEPPKTPLGQASAGASAEASIEQGTLPPAARTALDRGNTEFRAGKYALALASYREAARAAPGDATPYFGIYMAAQKLGQTKLADSASALISSLSGAAGSGLSDSTMRELHSAGTAPAKPK